MVAVRERWGQASYRGAMVGFMLARCYYVLCVMWRALCVRAGCCVLGVSVVGPNVLLKGFEAKLALGPKLAPGRVHGRVFRRGQTSRERRMREYRDAKTLALAA